MSGDHQIVVTARSGRSNRSLVTICTLCWIAVATMKRSAGSGGIFKVSTSAISTVRRLVTGTLAGGLVVGGHNNAAKNRWWHSEGHYVPIQAGSTMRSPSMV